MGQSDSLTTACVRQAFSDEIVAQRGSVSDAFDDGERLIVRAVLPLSDEVRTNDRFQGGVALKAWQGEVWVHPYIFRLVCRKRGDHGASLRVAPGECRV